MSKYVETHPLKDKEASTVAKPFVDIFLLRYGIPKEIVTDQGKKCIANIFKGTCKTLGIKKFHRSPPFFMGAIESSHKNVGAYFCLLGVFYTILIFTQEQNIRLIN